MTDLRKSSSRHAKKKRESILEMAAAEVAEKVPEILENDRKAMRAFANARATKVELYLEPLLAHKVHMHRVFLEKYTSSDRF